MGLYTVLDTAAFCIISALVWVFPLLEKEEVSPDPCANAEAGGEMRDEKFWRKKNGLNMKVKTCGEE